ncbi:hypothetical protein GUITHDRAFT_104516 [Guillardia theta CCMP2712]|uniref:Uncharacterized protein n=1 Tax=Guillardia theta (strain CCMP2712) TaxID=905079 RepID=L1JMQ3_GUITC|nr:hypothetical protein GUITHDRAFT_104516 [Guillardia theta CCMP2712]EKX49554.1 hypothetical protein GUITHDRAFT_104516 [Guillardia theta CCMP2712]|eukprot:XP_005836534.1 hypothetical protein GUITHDRAFT_104516 [Guillardia theta CCMP2712]
MEDALGLSSKDLDRTGESAGLVDVSCEHFFTDSLAPVRAAKSRATVSKKERKSPQNSKKKQGWVSSCPSDANTTVGRGICKKKACGQSLKISRKQKQPKTSSLSHSKSNDSTIGSKCYGLDSLAYFATLIADAAEAKNPETFDFSSPRIPSESLPGDKCGGEFSEDEDAAGLEDESPISFCLPPLLPQLII